jgi:hypothetical protein
VILAGFIFFVSAHTLCVLMLITHLREEQVRHEAEIHRHYSNLQSNHLDPL